MKKREIPGKRGIHGEKRERHEQNVPHHMNRTELTPEPITVSSHPSIPLFPPPLPSSFPFLAGLVCSRNLHFRLTRTNTDPKT